MTRAMLLLPLVAGCAAMPELPPGTIPVAAARYGCDDGTRFTARFDEYDQAHLRFEETDPAIAGIEPDFRITLTGQRPGSGIWYAGSGWSLRGKGADATLTRPDGRVSQCRAGPDAGDPGSVKRGGNVL